MRGTVFRYGDAKLLVTYHPAACLGTQLQAPGLGGPAAFGARIPDALTPAGV
jgi:hypothetical protein